ncbi:hypothetical protein PPYR_14012 [Photinus pyralis]|uniref:Cytochrome P450 n=1 Tax=Photinus pyralis TaxID=7054 RepID=A0A5N4A417_PHOPY|nr:probable cytochrome P450 6a14 [Photinus pyralis]KAB0792051.1 hypothetical protein PPYR_14012 [Photinus pyralis]
MSLAMIIILIVAVVIVSHLSFKVWYRRGVNSLHPVPFLGNLTGVFVNGETVFESMEYFYKSLKGEGKHFGTYYLFAYPTFVPIHLELIKRMLITDFEYFTDHIAHLDEKNDPITMNIFSLKGERWRSLREQLSPAFTPSRMRLVFENSAECARNLSNLIEGKGTIAIQDVCERYTIDFIISCCFGIESKLLQNEDSRFRKHAGELLCAGSWRSVLFMLSLILPQFFTIFKTRVFSKQCTEFWVNVVKETAKQREGNGSARKDVMQTLLQVAKDDAITDGSQRTSGGVTLLSFPDIAAQCFLILLAGFEGPATGISFTLIELALNQEYQDNARNEINSVLATHDGEVSYDAIADMKYLENCVLETLRKFPPLSVNTRLCTKDYHIPETDVVIRKGTAVVIPVYAVHRDPEYHRDPDKYDPSRFNEDSRRPLTTFMPFGGGPRTCIGEKLGILMAKLALTVLLRSFRFHVHPDTQPPFRFEPTSLIPKCKIPVKLIVERI